MNQPDPPGKFPVRDRIDAVCDRFEDAWNSGNRPEILAFLTQEKELRPHWRALVKELLEIDVELRLQHGEIPSASDYLPPLPQRYAEIVYSVIPQSEHETADGLSTTLTRSELIKILEENELLSLTRLQKLQSRQDSVDDNPEAAIRLMEELVKTEELTRYQAECVCGNDTQHLRIHQYALIDIIGRGGAGVVYRAVHRKMKREVAIKFLSPAALDRPEFVERFYREAAATARLTHPNIVTAYDVAEIDEQPYLVMEYVRGTNLSHLAEQNEPLPVTAVVDMLIQAATALQFAHEQGLIHRDVKPANFLLDDSGTVKLLDLGMARVREEVAASLGDRQLTRTGQIMGTLEFMSPEQALDVRKADERADIYSLGATMYRLLTNDPIYEGDSIMGMLAAHREAEIPSLAEARFDAGPQLDQLFRRMVAKEPEDRFQSMTEVIAALEACPLSGDEADKRQDAHSDRSMSESELGQVRGSKLADSTNTGSAGAVSPQAIRHSLPRITLIGIVLGLMALLYQIFS